SWLAAAPSPQGKEKQNGGRALTMTQSASVAALDVGSLLAESLVVPPGIPTRLLSSNGDVPPAQACRNSAALQGAPATHLRSPAPPAAPGLTTAAVALLLLALAAEAVHHAAAPKHWSAH